ncbi:MAG: superoxide dismutase [Acidimicrobiia bacterium]|jgi:Fe-Mn family superoxide dismutase
MSYSLPDLDYDYGALEPHLSARILELHHGKHHAAYVSGLNAVVDELAVARSADDFSTLPGLERKHAFNLAGHVLHSLFWKNLSPDGGGVPEGDLAAALDDGFGGFGAFRAQMSAATVSVMGSGWGALCWEPTGQRLYVAQLYDHQGNIGLGSQPLLVIDAWEHAYYLQYENRRADFVEAIWNVVNWADVAERFGAARAVHLV